MDNTSQLEKQISSLAIQGATNIALATLDGILKKAEELGSGDGQNIYDTLYITGKNLAYARPTEPLAQNALRFIFDKKNEQIPYYTAKIAEYKNLINSAKEKMALNISDLIKDGGTYLTHCHSSTVTNMLKESHKAGKKFKVIATETRPLFQGRITVKELLEAGLQDVTLIIDDVCESVIFGRLGKVDAVFIGADLLSSSGFVNKVGSMAMAYGARRNGVPLYSMSILLKYDPAGFSAEKIELRDRKEIWPEAPPNLEIYSPAFDYVLYDSGVKIVTENGIIDGREVKEKAQKQYPFLV